MPPLAPGGHLPRLGPEFYRGRSVVFWTHPVEQRGTAWLDENFHRFFREIALHASVRENLLCPIYALMPDHLHLIWMGTSDGSDQKRASTFLRQHLGPLLLPHRFQHQPYDHVLREAERRKKAFAATCAYIAENPVRAGLATEQTKWPYMGGVVPGYPTLDPRHLDFWDKFWRVYNAAAEHGHFGKIGRP
jgi:putative transposase